MAATITTYTAITCTNSTTNYRRRALRLANNTHTASPPTDNAKAIHAFSPVLPGNTSAATPTPMTATTPNNSGRFSVDAPINTAIAHAYVPIRTAVKLKNSTPLTPKLYHAPPTRTHPKTRPNRPKRSTVEPF